MYTGSVLPVIISIVALLAVQLVEVTHFGMMPQTLSICLVDVTSSSMRVFLLCKLVL